MVTSGQNQTEQVEDTSSEDSSSAETEPDYKALFEAESAKSKSLQGQMRAVGNRREADDGRWDALDTRIDVLTRTMQAVVSSTGDPDVANQFAEGQAESVKASAGRTIDGQRQALWSMVVTAVDNDGSPAFDAESARTALRQAGESSEGLSDAEAVIFGSPDFSEFRSLWQQGEPNGRETSPDRVNIVTLQGAATKAIGINTAGVKSMASKQVEEAKKTAKQEGRQELEEEADVHNLDSGRPAGTTKGRRTYGDLAQEVGVKGRTPRELKEHSEELLDELYANSPSQARPPRR